MSNKGFFRLTICSVIFFVLATSLMVFYCIQKDASPVEKLQMTDGEKADQTVYGYEDVYQDNQGELEEDKFLYIPLADTVAVSDIKIETDYLNKTVVLKVPGLDAAYFAKQKLYGNKKHVTDIKSISTSEGVSVEIALDTICDFDKKESVNGVAIEFYPIEDRFEKIVVLDPGHGEADFGFIKDTLVEKELCMDIAERVKAYFEETDIKVITTRTEDSNPNIEARVKFANDMKADMLISIHANMSLNHPKNNGIRTFYNQSFFIPEFSSTDFAYILEDEVTKATKATQLGLCKSEESIQIVREATVPVALLEVGYFSNEKEFEMLQTQEYREKIAEGICSAIIRSYQKKSGDE